MTIGDLMALLKRASELSSDSLPIFIEGPIEDGLIPINGYELVLSNEGDRLVLR